MPQNLPAFTSAPVALATSSGCICSNEYIAIIVQSGVKMLLGLQEASSKAPREQSLFVLSGLKGILLVSD